LSKRPDLWKPAIVQTTAKDGKGIAETLAAIRKYREFSRGKNRSVENWSLRLREMLRDRLLESFCGVDFDAAAAEVAARRADPYTLIEKWIQSGGR
jgi:putative protein kinase ArgK-like GTPase of G3E family